MEQPRRCARTTRWLRASSDGDRHIAEEPTSSTVSPSHLRKSAIREFAGRRPCDPRDGRITGADPESLTRMARVRPFTPSIVHRSTVREHPYYYVLLCSRDGHEASGYSLLPRDIRGSRSTDFRFKDFATHRPGVLPLPPLPEQAAIVRFLDHADRRIRRYIQRQAAADRAAGGAEAGHHQSGRHSRP